MLAWRCRKRSINLWTLQTKKWIPGYLQLLTQSDSALKTRNIMKLKTIFESSTPRDCETSDLISRINVWYPDVPSTIRRCLSQIRNVTQPSEGSLPTTNNHWPLSKQPLYFGDSDKHPNRCPNRCPPGKNQIRNLNEELRPSPSEQTLSISST